MQKSAREAVSVLERPTGALQATDATVPPDGTTRPAMIEAELLVEEISIVGMCGVY